MKLWTERDEHGIELLKRSWQQLQQHPTELIYAALLIANTLGCFVLLFLFEYHAYGVHLFDINSLANFSPFGFFDHLWHAVSLIALILFSIFSSLFIHASLNYTVVNDLAQKKTGLLPTLWYTAQHVHKLFLLSLIFLNHHIITLFDVLSVSPFLSAVQHDIEGQAQPDTHHTVSKSPRGRLVVPILLFNKESSITQALEESRRLIQAKLGTADGDNISFARIKIIMFAAASLAVLISTYFDDIDTLATIFLCGITILTVLRIIEVGLIIYHGCLYSYCTGGSSGAFTPEELRLFL